MRSMEVFAWILAFWAAALLCALAEWRLSPTPPVRLLLWAGVFAAAALAAITAPTSWNCL